MKISSKEYLEKVVSCKVIKVDYNNRIILFNFNNKDHTKIGEAYCDFNTLGDMTYDDIEHIFWQNSTHLCLLESFNDKLNMYKVLYGPLHPEIYVYPTHIIPTYNHNRRLFKILKEQINNYEKFEIGEIKNEENSSNFK